MGSAMIVAAAAEEPQPQQPVAESVGSAVVAMPLVRRLKQAAGDVPGLLEIVQDAEHSLPRDCHALSEVYKVAVDAGQSAAGAAQDSGYRELCVKHMRLLCKIRPDEARDFHNRQRAFSLNHGDARLYEARAALEEQQGDRAKALKMVNEGLRLGAQPAELLQQFLLDLEDRDRQPQAAAAADPPPSCSSPEAMLEDAEMVQEDMDLVDQHQNATGSQSSGVQPGSGEADCRKPPSAGRGATGSQCPEAAAPSRPSKLKHLPPPPPETSVAACLTADSCVFAAAASGDALSSASGGRQKLQEQRLQQQLRRQEAQQSRAQLQRLLASTERRRTIFQMFAAWKEVLEMTACRRREALFDSMRQQVMAAQRRSQALERRLDLQVRSALLRWAAGAWRSFTQLGRQTQRLADIAHQSGLRRSITRMLLEWRAEARCSVMLRSARLESYDQTSQSNTEAPAWLECLLQDMAPPDVQQRSPQSDQEASPVSAPWQHQEISAPRRTLTRSASVGPQRPAGMSSRDDSGSAEDCHVGFHSRSAVYLSPRAPLMELQSSKEAAGVPSGSEAKPPRCVRGPERFFYDTASYTGCHRFSGVGKENGKPSTESRGGQAPRKTRPPANGGGSSTPTAAGIQQAARRQNSSLLR